MNSSSLTNFDIIAILTASLTLIVSQSWNSLIQNSITASFPETDKSINVQFLYTLTLTLVSGSIIYILMNYTQRIKDLISKYIPIKLT